MKMPAPVGSVLATLFVSAVAMISASDCSADEPVSRWRADPYLDITRSSTNCGNQHKEAITMEFDGKILKTGAWSAQTYDIILQSPLNADGSGTVDAISMPLHRSMVVTFAPGHGPRPVEYWNRYFVGHQGLSAKCIYMFVPIKE
jgi:hypothetical protein